MVTVISTKQVRARKSHRCSTCYVVCIQPGDEYTRQVNAFDGTVYTWLTCADCRAISDVVWDYAGEPWDAGIGPDEYAEWAWEQKNSDPRAAAFLDRAQAGA